MYRTLNERNDRIFAKKKQTLNIPAAPPPHPLPLPWLYLSSSSGELKKEFRGTSLLGIMLSLDLCGDRSGGNYRMESKGTRRERNLRFSKENCNFQQPLELDIVSALLPESAGGHFISLNFFDDRAKDIEQDSYNSL